jgi:hypothetical protein
MRQSESINDLVTSLIKAKSEFTAVKRTKKANATATREYKYAELDGVIDAVEEALGKNGLVVLQFPRSDMERRTVTILTRLQHITGQFFEEDLEMPAAGEGGVTPRSMGSAITYNRRYSILPFLGIAPEDDDGAAANAGLNGGPKEIVRKSDKVPPGYNSPAASQEPGMYDDPNYENGKPARRAQVGITASGEPIFDQDGEPVVERPNLLTQQLQESIKKAPSSFVSGKTISEKQAARFWAIAKGSGKTKPQISDYLGKLGIEEVDDMPWKNYDQAIQWLQEA